jgi:poly [ADP-ribose] polymerase 2/3/4
MAPPATTKKKAPPAAAAAAAAPPSKKQKYTGLDKNVEDEVDDPSGAVAVAAMSSVATVAAASTRTDNKEPSASSKRKGPPVDPDISLHGHDASQYAVVKTVQNTMVGTTILFYDAVLNQCNIATNNNKYYRIQMLRKQQPYLKSGEKSYYVWHKWGRVGETAKQSASKWFGPFATEQTALPSFAKKFKDKTGNVFGDATRPFVVKAGKYTLVEIDSTVQVDEDEVVQSPAKAAAAARTKPVQKYLPSTLDDTTKELVQVLFSDDMRNEALAAFDLDLNKLPLGVPSQAQIQRGIAILGEIEDKLKQQQGSRSHEHYEQLSSRFYTAIPHSFGRRRPPTIASTEALRKCYDMCNILLDMYSTTETIRKIATAEQQQKPATAAAPLPPSPVDLHYQSLNANLTLLSKTTDEFVRIQTYFEMTKGKQQQGSAGHGRRPSAMLFNV